MSSPVGLLRLTGLAATLIVLAGVAASAESRVIELPIRGGALPSELRVIRVQQGDAVTLHWTTDRALTLHLHGYDVEQRVTPETTATMRFTAKAAGRFSIEIHGSEGRRASTLAYLEVHPR